MRNRLHAVFAVGIRGIPVASFLLSSACKNTPQQGQNLIEMRR
jgi:hypothetical protein